MIPQQTTGYSAQCHNSNQHEGTHHQQKAHHHRRNADLHSFRPLQAIPAIPIVKLNYPHEQGGERGTPNVYFGNARRGRTWRIQTVSTQHSRGHYLHLQPPQESRTRLPLSQRKQKARTAKALAHPLRVPTTKLGAQTRPTLQQVALYHCLLKEARSRNSTTRFGSTF